MKVLMDLINTPIDDNEYISSIEVDRDNIMKIVCEQ